MGAPLVEKRKMAMEWFAMHPEERLRAGLPPDRNKLRKYLGVTSSTLTGWEAKFLEQKTRDIMERSLYHAPEETEQSEEHTEDEKQEVLDALKDLCVKRGNAFAGKTWLQAKGEFIEKQEVKVGLTADEITRRNLEAERQLHEAGFGVEEVPKKSPLLPKNLRKS